MIIMNTYIPIWILFLTILRVSAALDVPGRKSIQKCYQYLKINAKDPSSSLKPLTEEELREIQQHENDNEADNFFAGGRSAKPRELPFMTALGYEYNNEKRFFCGGSLISDQFVITAAHCIFSKEWGLVKYIRLGDLNLASATDDVWAQEFTLAKYHIHPNYSAPQRYHDVALVKLDRPAILTDYVKPVCLEAKRGSLKGVKLYAAGWGLLGFAEDPSDRLQTGELELYASATCQTTFGKDITIPDGIVDVLQICAGGKEHIADTCEGDSGGPLAYHNLYPHDIFYLVGITSFGKACALAKLPGVYTRVSYYIEWIENIVWPDEEIKRTSSERIIFPDKRK